MNADIRPFFGDMPKQFAAADLLVCRAGATTLAEVTVAGKPAILVPFPQAADDHQRKNAEALARAGAAEMILQKELNGPTLAARIRFISSTGMHFVEWNRTAAHWDDPMRQNASSISSRN